ncbi:MAG: hypothetical protein RMM53_07870 [Bacteroidia bacterium]|nr:hypothetical protein [Bacteroidia bacterium]MDW8334117.1 hypothetical protein [Bacteroidia bacterium]
MTTQAPLKTWENAGLSVYADKVVFDQSPHRRELTLQDFLTEVGERYVRSQAVSVEMDEARRYVKALLETRAP